MKAILQTSYGAPEQVLLPGEIERPSPGPGEILVRVRASSVNTPDCIGTLGLPYVLRPLVVGLTGPVSPVRGSDLAGVVEAVGGGVADFAPGDEVFGSVWIGSGFARGARGAFCEYTVVPAAQLAPKPASTSFEEAAGAVMSGVTTLQALRDVGELRPGERVLINGASGGLGTFAVQIAKAMGAVVTGVCSTRNVALVRSLGADHVIDYTQADYTQGEARYDLIFDNVMNHPPAASAAVLAPGGRFILNSVGDDRFFGTLPQLAYMGLFKPKDWRTVEYRPLRRTLEALAALLDAGAVRVVVDRVYPVEQAGAAVAHMASRRARGKVVVSMGAGWPA